MARALLVITVERAVDPAGVPLVAYGGAGGLHACSAHATPHDASCSRAGAPRRVLCGRPRCGGRDPRSRATRTPRNPRHRSHRVAQDDVRPRHSRGEGPGARQPRERARRCQASLRRPGRRHLDPFPHRVGRRLSPSTPTHARIRSRGNSCRAARTSSTCRAPYPQTSRTTAARWPNTRRCLSPSSARRWNGMGSSPT